MSGGESDEALAGRFGDHESVAASATYLAGFTVEALALERREAVPATTSSCALPSVTLPSVTLTTVMMAWAGSESPDPDDPSRGEGRHRPTTSLNRSRGRLQRTGAVRRSDS